MPLESSHFLNLESSKTFIRNVEASEILPRLRFRMKCWVESMKPFSCSYKRLNSVVLPIPGSPSKIRIRWNPLALSSPAHPFLYVARQRTSPSK